MSAEVNARSSLNEAFVMIRILELIPQHRWITMTQIRNQLAANGIPLQRRTLERYMKTIRENPQLFPVKANMDSRPYGFQWSVPRKRSFCGLPMSTCTISFPQASFPDCGLSFAMRERARKHRPRAVHPRG